jgi:hypothetical protein
MNGHLSQNDPTEPSLSPRQLRQTTPTGKRQMWTKRRRTADEQAIVDALAKAYGREYGERHAELAIEQAMAIGELPDFDDGLIKTRVVAATPTRSGISC